MRQGIGLCNKAANGLLLTIKLIKMIYVSFIVVLLIYVVFFKMSMDKIKNDYTVLMEDKNHFFEKKTQDILKSSRRIEAQQFKVRQSLNIKIEELERKLKASEAQLDDECEEVVALKEILKRCEKARFNKGRTKEFNNKDWLIMYKKHGNKENASQIYHCNNCSKEEAKTQFRNHNGDDSVITMIKEV